MGLEADVRFYLPQFRTEAESLMFERVTIGTETETVDPSSLETTIVAADPVYVGVARLKWVSTTVSTVDVSGQSVAVQAVIMKLPAGSAVIDTGKLVVVDSSEIDPALAGRKFRVSGRPASGTVTAHRYSVEEIS